MRSAGYGNGKLAPWAEPVQKRKYRKICYDVEINFVELERCCKMSLSLQESGSIEPRTPFEKFNKPLPFERPRWWWHQCRHYQRPISFGFRRKHPNQNYAVDNCLIFVSWRLDHFPEITDIVYDRRAAERSTSADPSRSALTLARLSVVVPTHLKKEGPAINTSNV